MVQGSGTTRSNATSALSAEDVADFLRANPEFLANNPDLLEALLPPSEDRGTGVYDFQKFMVQSLQRESRRVKSDQHALIATTRANMNNLSRIHSAILFLLEAQSLEQFIYTITNDLAVLLDVDTVALVVESNGQDHPHVHRSGVRVVPPATVDEALGNREILLQDHCTPDSRIFGPATGLVASQALIRLDVSCETPYGLIGFGSRDPAMFHEGQGTELIGFLARVIERCIRSWLSLPA